MNSRRRSLLLDLLFFAIVAFALNASVPLNAQPAPIQPAVAPHVDERVELLSIVFRLADNPEYNMNTLPKYSADIDKYFAAFKDHPAVRMAGEIRAKQGVGYDAVMSMAISLSDPPQLKPLVPFKTHMPDERWAGANPEKFLRVLHNFYRDSKFADFYAAHQEFYHLAESRFAATLSSVKFDWYPRFYGSAATLDYHLILGMNNGGGNYGPRLPRPDGSMELFSIIGCWTHDDSGDPTYPPDKGYLATIIHEFNHSFVNPAVAEHWSEFKGAEQVFENVKEQMQRLAYGNAETMVNESLVRAAVIVYFQEADEETARNQRRIRSEQRNGFPWMGQLVEKLREYEANRAQYPNLSAYMPQIEQFFADLSDRMPAFQAEFDSKSAHVVKVEPFANHAQDVDSSLTAITIVLDKPLDPKAGYSLTYGPAGQAHFPLAGKPQFEDGGLRLVLPVALKPNETYTIVLLPIAFSTADGYPLVEYTVDFKTK
jgi:hypothetical protein